MDELNLKIIMDPEKLNREFMAGDVLQGTLQITVLKQVYCKYLNLSFGWAIEDKKMHKIRPNPKSEKKQFISKENLSPEEVRSFSFSFTIPEEGPFNNFHGKYFDFFYCLNAQAHLRLKTIVEHLPLKVSPSNKQDVIYNLGSEKLLPKNLEKTPFLEKFLNILLLGILFIFVFGPLTLFLLSIPPFIKDKEGFFLLLLTIITPLLFFVSLLNSPPKTDIVDEKSKNIKFSNFFSKIRSRYFTIGFQKFSFYPGESVFFEIGYPSKNLDTLKEIRVYFSAQEIFLNEAGRASSYKKQTLVEEKRIYTMNNTELPEKINDQFIIPQETPYFLDVLNNYYQIRTRFFIYFYFSDESKIQLTKSVIVIPKNYKILEQE